MISSVGCATPATAPNQLWSWDITKLKGPENWNYYHLYVVLDVYSRYMVGWMVADRESATLAKKLIAEICQRERIEPGQLTVHADRGSSMRSKCLALMLADLGVTKTHSRPHVSDDNPCSESHFKTLKYRPDFPARFGSLEDARAFCKDFFDWYNLEHHHASYTARCPSRRCARATRASRCRPRGRICAASTALREPRSAPRRFAGRRVDQQTARCDLVSSSKTSGGVLRRRREARRCLEGTSCFSGWPRLIIGIMMRACSS